MAATERERLNEAESRIRHWKRWGPYLAERAWGTVREDYSADGSAWEYFPHDHARSRAYRWTEDGILGICDNHQRLCFALAFWNYADPILKERLFGLTGHEGNHGEDVKEVYYYLDSTPTHSYLKGLYKYPHAAFPYARLVDENRRRTRLHHEFEIQDTGIFSDGRYFDVLAEYAKQDVNDILIRITITNRAATPGRLLFLPTLWFRNTWSWCLENSIARPQLSRTAPDAILCEHQLLGNCALQLDGTPQTLFTENETNGERLWKEPHQSRHYKDGFHDYLIGRRAEAVASTAAGTKACAVYPLELGPGEQRVLRFRLAPPGVAPLTAERQDAVIAQRLYEADEFYSSLSADLDETARSVQRQAFAGLFWSKQFYHYVVYTWLKGDPTMPPPPVQRKYIRNREWTHLFNDDVISMPDKWEYPWYAAWDLAFHTVAMAPADPDYAKQQLALFLREWYLHPNGQIPAYEWSFSDANPPVHAWACWRVYQIDCRLQGRPDYEFLERVFHKLLVNFTWWVNRKDSEGANLFEGGFLGLDNIGVFDRNTRLPNGGVLSQSDGTSWMGMYCLNMLKIAMTLARVNSAYEDIASKFFEHFLHIARAIHYHHDTGLWDERDGFYYDRIRYEAAPVLFVRLRSMVGLIPLFASETLEQAVIDRLPQFKKRMDWFINHRPDLMDQVASLQRPGVNQRRLLSVVNRSRLERILKRVFDPNEFLSPFGIRSLSRAHAERPFVLPLDGQEHTVHYEPGESESALFGGNSNWRGPVWFPLNFLLVEALQRFHYYYGDAVTVELPAGSGRRVALDQAARELSQRLSSLFLPDERGDRPVYDGNALFQKDPHFRDHVLFYEYFHGDTGAGLGASHQTGWTGLVAKLLQQSGTSPRAASRPEPAVAQTR